MKRLENHTLAIGVASILILAASGVATPALTALAATSSNDNNNNNKNDDKNNKDVLHFLIDVIQCFTNNDPHSSNGTNSNTNNGPHSSNDNNNSNNNDHHNKPFTHDVKQCLYDVIDKYFPNNDNNKNNNNENNKNNNKNNNNSY